MDDVLHQADTDMASVSVKKEEGGGRRERRWRKKKRKPMYRAVFPDKPMT